MRQLIIQEWLSLDGFATDRQNKLDFFVPTIRDIYKDEYYAKYLESIDGILFGKNTYNQFSATWPSRGGDALSHKINDSEKIVFSTSLQSAPWGKWNPAKVISGDFRSTIQELKSGSGKNMVIWGSLSLAQTAMHEGLVDQYHLHICPVITGGGRKLFIDGPFLSMNLLHSKQFDNGVISLHYQL